MAVLEKVGESEIRRSKEKAARGISTKNHSKKLGTKVSQTNSRKKSSMKLKGALRIRSTRGIKKKSKNVKGKNCENSSNKQENCEKENLKTRSRLKLNYRPRLKGRMRPMTKSKAKMTRIPQQKGGKTCYNVNEFPTHSENAQI